MPIQPGNRNRYPKDWKLRSRFIRFYRARGRCEWCGAVHGQPHPMTGSKVVLTVAHVWDQRPEAASFLNLAALCQRCHLGHDLEHHIEQRRVNRWRRLEERAAAGGQLRLDALCVTFAGTEKPSASLADCLPHLAESLRITKEQIWSDLEAVHDGG